MFGREKKPVGSQRIDTLIARDAQIRGDLAFSGGLHLDGRIDGSVRAASADVQGTLWVGEQGSVVGNVDVAHVVIHGQVSGDVRGTERVVLGRTARVQGDVRYGSIEMTLGARIEGRLIPLDSAPERLIAPLPSPSAAGAERVVSASEDFQLASFDGSIPRT